MDNYDDNTYKSGNKSIRKEKLKDVEKHLIYKLLTDKDFDTSFIKQEDFKYLDLEFIKQYELINTLKALGADVDKTQLNTIAIIEDKVIDIHYPRENKELTDFDIKETYKLYLQKKEGQRSLNEVKSILDNVKITDKTPLKEAKKKIDEMLIEKEEVQIKTFRNAKEEQLEFLENVFKGKEVDGLYLHSYTRKMSQQFKGLGKMLKYIGKEDLVILAGRTSVGKTSFALSLLNVLTKQGNKALFFSLEMTASQIIHRMAMAKSYVSNDDIFKKEIDQRNVDKYHEGIDELATLPIEIVESGLESWMAMKEIIIKKKDDIDFVMIDHLTYIPSYDSSVDNNFHALYSKIIRDIKQTAKEYKIPMVVLAQLSRGVAQGQKGTKKDDRYYEVFARDLRESGSIEEYADKLLLLYREESEYEDKSIYKITCKVEKNRDGRTGKVSYWFEAAYNRWKEIEEER